MTFYLYIILVIILYIVLFFIYFYKKISYHKPNTSKWILWMDPIYAFLSPQYG